MSSPLQSVRHTGSLPLMAATCRQSTISCIISLDLGAAGSLCRHLAEKREEGSLMTCSRSRSWYWLCDSYPLLFPWCFCLVWKMGFFLLSPITFFFLYSFQCYKLCFYYTLLWRDWVDEEEETTCIEDVQPSCQAENGRVDCVIENQMEKMF